MSCRKKPLKFAQLFSTSTGIIHNKNIPKQSNLNENRQKKERDSTNERRLGVWQYYHTDDYKLLSSRQLHRCTAKEQRAYSRLELTQEGIQATSGTDRGGRATASATTAKPGPGRTALLR